MKQAQTAIVVYHEAIRPTLHGRQLFVRDQLERFCREYDYRPTAGELVRYVAAKFPHRLIDVNTIRPRLTEMHEQGWVSHAGKRICSVTGKRVYTWRVSAPQPPVREPQPQSLQF